ncbi:hypothetical protein WJX73_007844 [Symbiochloris irregularis]|uniref:WW domain-containing protein n=1 Tax=Symbiochloris irregularis TaxID=706552 RepID=A0AAW1P9A5_9CHLO
MPARRHRLQLAETKGEDDAEDPVAAAIAAKRQREENLVRAAAAAAARNADADITTLFRESKGPSAHSRLPATSPESDSSRGVSQTNPLATLLGYSHDSDDAAQQASEPGVAPHSAPHTSSAAVKVAPPGGIPAAEQLSPSVPDVMDAEVASFLGELEASGLLTDADEPPNDNHAGVAAPVNARREYFAQPVRSSTPPITSYSSTSGHSAVDANLHTEPQALSQPQHKAERAPEPVRPSAKRRKTSKVPKGASALIDKWQSVRKDIAVDEDEEGAPVSAEALERERVRKAAQWKEQQLAQGVTAEDNPNLQPLTGDWREKVRAAKVQSKSKPGQHETKQEPKSKAAAAATKAPLVAAAAPDGRPDLAALTLGLPEGWRAMWDKHSNDVYYGNLSTKETTWARPS